MYYVVSILVIASALLLKHTCYLIHNTYYILLNTTHNKIKQQ